MTREEAIKRLEWLRMVGNHVDSVTLGKEDMPYFDMAISALREQEERSKGCEWCYPNKLCGTCLHNVDYHEDGTDKCCATLYEVPCSHYKSFPFCPMCGRRLEEV